MGSSPRARAGRSVRCASKSERTAAHRWDSPRRATAVMALLVLATFGLPEALGLTWWQLPQTILRPRANDPRLASLTRSLDPSGATDELAANLRDRQVGYPAALDPFSFSHVDWPFRVIEAGQLRRGELPLWDADSSLGLPLAGQYQNQVFFPVEWLEILGGLRSWTFIYMLKMVLAGLGTYLFLRRAHVAPVGALAGGIAYMFSSYFLWFYPIAAFVNGALLVPWLFLSVRLLLPPETLSMRAVGAVGLTIGMSLLAGQPQLAVLNLLAGGMYFGIVLLLSPRGPWDVLRGVAFAAGAVLGLAVSAIMLVTFSESLGNGYTIHGEGAYGGAGTALLNFPLMLSPFLMGQLMLPWSPALPYVLMNWEAFPVAVGAFGALATSLALVSLPTRMRADRAAPHIWALLAIALLVFGIVGIGTAGYGIFWGLPGLNRVNLPRYGAPVVSFALAGLIGWGVAAVGRLNAGRLIVANAIVLALAAGALYLWSPYLLDIPPTADPNYVRASLWLGSVPFVGVLVAMNVALMAGLRRVTSVGRVQAAVIICLVAQSTFFVRYGLALPDELKRLGVLGLMLAAAILVLKYRARWVAPVFVVAVVATAAIILMSPRGLPVERDLFATEPDLVRLLKDRLGDDSRGGRVLATRGITTPNVLSAFGVAELGSANPVQVGTTAQFLLKAFADRQLSYIMPTQWLGLDDAAPDYPGWADFRSWRRFFDFVGTRILLDLPNGVLDKGQVENVQKLYGDDQVVVYENRGALPRAFIVSSGVAVASSEEAEQRMVTPDFDLSRSVVVEDPNGSFPSSFLGATGAPPRVVEIRDYGDEHVDLTVDDGPFGMLVLTDAFYPGWTAYVDDQPREIYRADLAVRAIAVEPGRHLISFRYEPPYLPSAARLSLLGVAICAILLGWRRLAALAMGIRPARRVPVALARLAVAVGAFVACALLIFAATTAYFGRVGAISGGPWRTPPQPVRLADRPNLTVLYVPRPVNGGAQVWTQGANGEPMLVPAPDVAALGSNGQMLATQADGHIANVQAEAGSAVTVSNVGAFDPVQRRYAQAQVTFANGRWSIDPWQMLSERQALTDPREPVFEALTSSAITPDMTVYGADGILRPLKPMSLVWIADTGRLVRVKPNGSLVAVVAHDGERVVVANAGAWDPATGRLRGAELVARNDFWSLAEEQAGMQPASRNLFVKEDNPSGLPTGFWMSPADAQARLRWRWDAEPAVRVDVAQATPYLALTSQAPLPTLDNTPITLVARVRGKTSGDIRLTLYDVVADDGRAEPTYVSVGASDEWSELVLRVERVKLASESDNFSVGVFGAAPGDWFEVADLRLFVGILP